MARTHLALACLLSGLTAAAAIAQPDPLGIQFVTVGSPGNPAYQSPDPLDPSNGRGSVAQPYRIGLEEVTTSQWVSFYNAAYDRPANDRIPFVTIPGGSFWGAVPTTPNTPGGLRWTVPAGNEMRPVGDISWRTAAILCNWLCHGANPNPPRTDFLDGAYQVATFGQDANNNWTDQLSHNPDARYFIPTWDQWMKAAHWSPSNPNNNGWFQYSNSSDSPYVYGPPGIGTANSGFHTPNPFSIPLGSYSAQSPWGLLDVAGATTEWTESIRTINTGERFRIYDGSYWDEGSNESIYADQVRYQTGDELPFVDSLEFGFRIASTVPSPSPCALGVGMLLVYCKARRRHDPLGGQHS
jgi:formylglycine-generating enzyme required for sulfatase activity